VGARVTAVTQPKTEEQIYDAAVRLIAEWGYHGMTLRQVAAEVGIKMASLYYHYDSKQQILVRIMERTIGELTAEVGAAVDAADGREEKLRAAIRAHVRFHALNRAAAFVTDAELRSLEPANRRRMIRLRDDHEAIFTELVGDKLLVYALLSACTGVAGWFRPGRGLSPDEVAERYADIFLRSLSGTAAS
jgi:AcrR family transcriptional regulator